VKSAADPESWAAFRNRFVDVDDDGYRRAVAETVEETA